MTTQQYVPLLVIPFIAWRMYIRVRRNVGRQPLRPARLKVSIGIFIAVTLVLIAFSFPRLPVLGALVAGLVLAVPIALSGLKLTKFEDTPEGKFYTPNTAIGIGISALFVGRIAYRFIALAFAPALSAPPAPQTIQSPLTLFLFGLSAGYFIAYQTGVLTRSRRPAA